jgi:hypothetical protein
MNDFTVADVRIISHVEDRLDKAAGFEHHMNRISANVLMSELHSTMNDDTPVSRRQEQLVGQPCAITSRKYGAS